MKNINMQLEKISPSEGDIFILTMFVDDPDIIFDESIQESTDQLSEVLSDHLGFNIQIITLPDDLSMCSRNQLEALIKQLRDSLTNKSDIIDISDYL